MDVRRPLIALVSVSLCLLAACASSDGGGPAAPTGPAPLPVTDLVVTGGADGRLDLQWTSPALPAKADGEIAYELRATEPGREDDPFAAWTVLAAPAPDVEAGLTHEHAAAGLLVGHTYALAVRARWGEGPWSERSNPVIATAAAAWDQTRPAPVQGLRQWAADRTWLTVAWAAAADDSIYGTATGYDVRWAAAPIDQASWATAHGHDGPVIAASKPGWLQTTITDLPETTHIWVAVRAVDDAGLRSAVGTPAACLTDTMRVWYVNAEGTGDAPTIEAAAQAAHVGDIVLVAPGHYTWTNQGTGDLLYGLINIPRNHTGFTIMSEAGPEATIIDAEHQGPCMVITGVSLGPGQDVTLWPGITVDGFTMTGGRAVGPPGSSDELYAGGGLTTHLNSAHIRNCIIRGNEATQGGGLWCGGQGIPTFENLVIEDNRAEYGGGLMLINCEYDIDVTGCTIRNNSAVQGGGVMIYNQRANLRDCVIEHNAADDFGGGVVLGPSGHPVTFEDVVIRDNTAKKAAGVGVSGGEFHFTRVVLDGNDATSSGGAMQLSGDLGDATLDQCTIVGNGASLGAAFRVENGGFATITSCIVAGNVRGQAFSSHFQSGFAMGCCDIWGNASDNAWPEVFDDLGGIFRADPRFCPSGYGLLADSPCLPGQHPDQADCGPIGAYAAGCGG